MNGKHDAAGHGHKHEYSLGLKSSILCLVTLLCCCYKAHFTVAWLYVFLTTITASQANCPAPSDTFSLELGWISISQHCSWSCCVPRLCPIFQDTDPWLHRDQQPAYLSPKILCIWPILFSSRAVLLALSAWSVCAACEEWQSSSASARLDNVLLNWVHQMVGGTQSLKGRVQAHYKVIYLYQRATPGTVQWFCRLPVMAALLKACDRDGFCANNFL